MITPTIHSNGTGKDMLQRDYMAARQAILDAIEAMRKIEFNARDYYPQGPEAWNLAREEQLARFRAIEKVADDFEKIAISIVDAP